MTVKSTLSKLWKAACVALVTSMSSTTYSTTEVSSTLAMSSSSLWCGAVWYALSVKDSLMVGLMRSAMSSNRVFVGSTPSSWVALTSTGSGPSSNALNQPESTCAVTTTKALVARRNQRNEDGPGWLASPTRTPLKPHQEEHRLGLFRKLNSTQNPHEVASFLPRQSTLTRVQNDCPQRFPYP